MRTLCPFALLLTLLSPNVRADEPKLRVFAGQITDVSGKPIKGAAVEWGYFNAARERRERREIFGKVVDAESGNLDYQSCRISATPEGQYRIEGVLPGTYVVSMHKLLGRSGIHRKGVDHEIAVSGETVQDFPDPAKVFTFDPELLKP